MFRHNRRGFIFGFFLFLDFTETGFECGDAVSRKANYYNRIAQTAKDTLYFLALLLNEVDLPHILSRVKFPSVSYPSSFMT